MYMPAAARGLLLGCGLMLSAHGFALSAPSSLHAPHLARPSAATPLQTSLPAASCRNSQAPRMVALPSALATVAAMPARRLVTLAVALAGVVFVWLARILNTPSRTYDREKNTVGREYDAWTSEGILEYYWGEHIHLGYYAENERKQPFYGGKDFIEAKYDFIDKMLQFSEVS